MAATTAKHIDQEIDSLIFSFLSDKGELVSDLAGFPEDRERPTSRVFCERDSIITVYSYYAQKTVPD
jgi:hypothetical protein